MKLEEVLPRVTSILIIGWRGTEEHFLRLLDEHLRPQVRVFVVAESLQVASRIAVAIKSSLGKCQPDAAGEAMAGFSHFILSGRHIQILEDPIAK